MKIHAETLVDSIVSFNTVHCNIKRCESESFNDRSFMIDDIALKHGLEAENTIAAILYSGYALEKWCGENKFGPNYVKFITPATNIRITTFVAGETEVKVIDPNKLEIIKSEGCDVTEVEI